MHRFMQRRGMASFAVKSLLEDKLTQFPTKNALRVTHQNIRWTYANLHDHSSAVANGLVDVGLAPGGCVGAVLGNNAEHVSVMLGAASAGIKVASASGSDKVTKDSLDKLLKENKCSVLFVSPDKVSVVYELIPELKGMRMDQSVELNISAYPELKYICHTGLAAVPGLHRFRDMLLYNAIPDRLEGITEKDDAPFLVYVDGSSGATKSEMTQKEAIDAAEKKASDLKIETDARVLFKVQKDFPPNLVLGTLASVGSLAQLVIPSESFDEAACAKAMEEDACNVTLK
ncbi:Long-chain fatty acid transport protein 4 [Hondaea fermentalgiana]|uniref:Long-chain fatty acid transport protein 4 n=1 Tax=Hondaea fermentalgiana TaxID=2315210 RepID=A0A2R5GFS8_9STRA|nr:Long-chain fatty acid transport protein 4 [Hondaea fermentalgiana]|eukprot:GBG29737.1 Long-chain fatty acid transport protein 4 [Hondaea fermentalgiana]